jgi:deoxyribodipyrimidine photo-lyase
MTVVYILDEDSPAIRPLGGAAKWWLHHSLAALSAELESKGSRLLLRRGAAFAELRRLAEETDAGSILWNRRYGLAERTVDAGIKEWAAGEGITATSFQANLLFEPWTVRTGTGGPYKVFTPFWRSCLAGAEPRMPADAPQRLPQPAPAADGSLPVSDSLDSWGLLPRRPDWSTGLAQTWTPGERGAGLRLEDFLDGPVEEYGTGRDLPGVEGTSRLSPHLRFGEISPFRVWQALRQRFPRNAPADVGIFRSELGWREFCWHLLYENPGLATDNYRREFDRFAWQTPSDAELTAWHQGRTGYPLIDAGMRQLWQTGWMHNRVRMAAASFLVKNLLADWRLGEAWFWDTLVDADAASNPANWQWVAGSGADASPYFRIFNPVTQSKKFDSRGRYLRRFIPELADLDDKAVHEPWKDSTAADAYPAPLVGLQESRARALDAYQQLKDG